jgi:GTPase SAR1 family protein
VIERASFERVTEWLKTVKEKAGDDIQL